MMMKLSRLLRTSRSTLPKNLSEGLALYAYNSQSGFSTFGHNSSQIASGDKISASYNVFKGKAALYVTPVLPTFSRLDSGFVVISRKGSVMLKFMPAIGERKYDTEKKQIFALSPTEVGSVISMGSTDSCEFFHDPSLLSVNSGQVRKTLSIKAHAAADGYMVSLSVVNNLLKTRDNINVPLTTAEFSVMKTACSYVLPHILGWGRLVQNTGSPLDSGEIVSSPPKIDRRILQSEWEK